MKFYKCIKCAVDKIYNHLVIIHFFKVFTLNFTVINQNISFTKKKFKSIQPLKVFYLVRIIRTIC